MTETIERPRIGSLFSGYGGLDLAVEEVFAGDTVWVSDIDKGACAILAHRRPDVPNLGDISLVDWTLTPRVKVMTGGFPCQDVSAAGKRAGIRHGTRSGLWLEFLRAIEAQHPDLVVIENVRGLLSARGAESDELDDAITECDRLTRVQLLIGRKLIKAQNEEKHEHAQRHTRDRLRIMGQLRRAVDARRRAERRIVRAIGTVLGQLANIGYDAAWHGLRAADIGAAHGRYRIFILAWPTDTPRDAWWLWDRDSGTAPDPDSVRVHRTGGTRHRRTEPTHSGERPGVTTLLPTPDASAHKYRLGGDSQQSNSLAAMARRGDLTLLPTPAVNDMGEGKTVEKWDDWTGDMKAKHGNGNGHGKSLAIEAQRLLPTPTTDPVSGNGHARDLGTETRLLPTPSVADSEGGHERRGGARGSELLLNGVAKAHAADRLLPTPMVGSSTPAAHGQVSGQWRDAMAEALTRWGDYAPAVCRWESVIGRTAPSPTQVSGKGNPQLAPPFVEWMMGLPAGWVTDVPGLTRNEMLKALGNGVVPQQAEAALRILLARVRAYVLAA